MSMMLVDKFALETVRKENIRRLPPNLASGGFFAQLCFVEGVSEKTFSIAEEKIKLKSTLTARSVAYDMEKDSLALTFEFLGK